MNDELAREMVGLLKDIRTLLDELVEQRSTKTIGQAMDITARGTPFHHRVHAVSVYNNPALKSNVDADSVERFGKRSGSEPQV